MNITKSPAVLAKRENMLSIATQIDQLAAQASGVFESASGFAEAIIVAQTMNDIRSALTDEMMQPVMALMNSPLGFVTDQDPKTNRDAKPYSVEVVRECFIESKLRGFNPVGNEWNIIAGRFYAAKNGLRRKVTKFPGLTEFRDTYDVPRMASEKGAILKSKATWKLNGVADSIEAEIPVRVNAYMGSDAIIGKAERKLLKRVLDRVSGFCTPDGEVGDEPAAMTTINVAAEVAAPKFAELPAKSEPAKETASSKVSDELPSHANVAAILDRGQVKFDDFRDWLVTTGRMEDAKTIKSAAEIPDKVLAELLADDAKSLQNCITIYGKAK